MMTRQEAQEFLNLITDDIHESRHESILNYLEKSNYLKLNNRPSIFVCSECVCEGGQKICDECNYGDQFESKQNTNK
jgi:hypothetical protein